jgi:ribosome-interacting GTPase 1
MDVSADRRKCCGMPNGSSQGSRIAGGRGRQVIAVAKSSDLVLMVLDAAKESEKNHRAILEAELEMVGLRLNKEPPNIFFRKRKKLTIWGGGSCTAYFALASLMQEKLEA